MITILLEKIKALLSELKTNIENINTSTEFSTNETIIGKDIDGATLYSKTFVNTTTILSQTDWDFNIGYDNAAIVGFDPRNTFFDRGDDSTRLFMNSFFPSASSYSISITSSKVNNGNVSVRVGRFPIEYSQVTVIFKKIENP